MWKLWASLHAVLCALHDAHPWDVRLAAAVHSETLKREFVQAAALSDAAIKVL